MVVALWAPLAPSRLRGHGGAASPRVQEVGAERVGVRLTPYGQFLQAFDSDPVALFTHAVRECSARGVAYVHMIEPRVAGNVDCVAREAESLAPFREAATVPFIAAGGYTRDTAARAAASGSSDLVRIVFLHVPCVRGQCPARGGAGAGWGGGGALAVSWDIRVVGALESGRARA
jgi:NADH:flavin oxidoreductase / NADH oxidase family